MESRDEFQRATARGAQRRETEPHAVSALYSESTTRVVITLNTGMVIGVPVDQIEGLAGASAADLAEIEVEPFGFGLYWPRLDADVYIPGLLQGILGSKKWMAAIMGKAGGQVRTPRKIAASRINGAKGGRPRKVTSAS